MITAMWGVQDKFLHLRQQLHQRLKSENKSGALYRRWRWQQTQSNMEVCQVYFMRVLYCVRIIFMVFTITSSGDLLVCIKKIGFGLDAGSIWNLRLYGLIWFGGSISSILLLF